MADLKLESSDPSGPVAVGSPAVYEIHIKNRGASSAKDVNVVGLFSEGIEPEQAEGAMYTVADGRVSFKTIEDLPAGRDVVLRIRAHAVSLARTCSGPKCSAATWKSSSRPRKPRGSTPTTSAPDSGKPEKQAAGAQRGVQVDGAIAAREFATH